MRARSSLGVTILLSAAVCLLLFQIWLLRQLGAEPVIAWTALPLDGLPSAIGPWRYQQDVPGEPLPSGMRDADESVARTYKKEGSGITVRFVVAYYRSQVHVHQQYDFEEYLPAEGWSRSSLKVACLPQQMNLIPRVRCEWFLRGAERRLVIRWFETKDSVVAGGNPLRSQRVLDLIAHRRTDFARVQMVAPVPSDNPEQAQQDVLLFAQKLIELTRRILFRD